VVQRIRAARQSRHQRSTLRQEMVDIAAALRKAAGG